MCIRYYPTFTLIIVFNFLCCLLASFNTIGWSLSHCTVLSSVNINKNSISNEIEITIYWLILWVTKHFKYVNVSTDTNVKSGAEEFLVTVMIWWNKTPGLLDYTRIPGPRQCQYRLQFTFTNCLYPRTTNNNFFHSNFVSLGQTHILFHQYQAH